MIVEPGTADPQHSVSIALKLLRDLSYGSRFRATENGLFSAANPVKRTGWHGMSGVRRLDLFKTTECNKSIAHSNGILKFWLAQVVNHSIAEHLCQW